MDQKKLEEQQLIFEKPSLGSSLPVLIGAFKHSNKIKESVRDFLKPIGRCSCYGIPDSIHVIKSKSALAALFVNGCSPVISGSIRRKKKKWKSTGLTELMARAEHFERTLEQDHNLKKKSIKLFALHLRQLQGQRPKITPGLPHFTLQGVQRQNDGLKIHV